MRVQSRRSGRPLTADTLADPRLDRLAEWGSRLAAAGLSPEASGNLSCRSENGFLITATGVPLGAIHPENWVEVTGVDDAAGGALVIHSNGVAEPSRDAAVHAALYEHRSAAGAVFHLHVGNLDELHDRIGVAATRRYFPAGTIESVAEIRDFLAGHSEVRYFILIDHGIVAWGPTIDEAGAEVLARQRALEET